MQRGTKAVVGWIAAVACGLPQLAQADYYSYTKENGSVGYADELRQVPARYRDSAERHADQPLSSYPRLTESQKPAGVAADRTACADASLATEAALDRCRAALASASDASDDSSAGRGRQGGHDMLIEAGHSVYVPVPEGEEPVRVDRHRPRWKDGRYRYFTIVRRGERVISEIEER